MTLLNKQMRDFHSTHLKMYNRHIRINASNMSLFISKFKHF